MTELAQLTAQACRAGPVYRIECLLYGIRRAGREERERRSWPSRNELGGLERARVNSERQPARRAGRERQALAAACRRRGWRVLESVDEVDLAAKQRNAPGLEQALRLLESGEANALVAVKRERLDRALGELAALLASAQRQGWALVALDCAGQTTTPAASASTSVLASFARCEPRSISERTKAALAAARAQGVRLGRPPQMSEYALERIRSERAAGKSLAAIANGLDADRIPTAQGGRRWYPATVRYTLKRTG